MRALDKAGIRQERKAAKKEQGDDTEYFERTLAKRKTEQYVLRLYIAGNNSRSQIAVRRVRKICEDYFAGRYDLEVIDICHDQSKNLIDLVHAAPTLIRKLPLPLRRIVGDMTRKEKVLVGLDIIPR